MTNAATIDQMVGKEQRFVGVTQGNSQWISVTVTSQLGWWQRRALQALYEISLLPADWDSYGSRSPSDICLKSAARFIIQADRDSFLVPRVVPISGGAVQLVWAYGARELELEFSTLGFIEYLKSENGEPFDEGWVAIEDRSTIQALLSWLIA